MACDPTIAQAGEVLAAINDGEGEDYKGTLGRLINDPELARHARGCDLGRARGDQQLLPVQVVARHADRVQRVLADPAVLRDRRDPGAHRQVLPGRARAGRARRRSRPTRSAMPPAPARSPAARRSGTRCGSPPSSASRSARSRSAAGSRTRRSAIGVDALIGEGRLKLSADLFGSFERTPRLKLAAAFAVFRSIYLIAGHRRRAQRARLPPDQQRHQPGRAEPVRPRSATAATTSSAPRCTSTTPTSRRCSASTARCWCPRWPPEPVSRRRAGRAGRSRRRRRARARRSRSSGQRSPLSISVSVRCGRVLERLAQRDARAVGDLDELRRAWCRRAARRCSSTSFQLVADPALDQDVDADLSRRAARSKMPIATPV